MKKFTLKVAKQIQYVLSWSTITKTFIELKITFCQIQLKKVSLYNELVS
jgi:hypothetical protein